LMKSKDPRLRIDVYTLVDSTVVAVTTSSYLLYPCSVVPVVGLPDTIHHDRWVMMDDWLVMEDGGILHQ
jgi:hypothetical protein